MITRESLIFLAFFLLVSSSCLNKSSVFADATSITTDENIESSSEESLFEKIDNEVESTQKEYKDNASSSPSATTLVSSNQQEEALTDETNKTTNFRIKWGSPHLHTPKDLHTTSIDGQTSPPFPVPNAHTTIPKTYITHTPPESFQITAKIAHNSKGSYFDTSNDLPKIPFLECNSIGTATPSIPSQQLYFRSFPKSAHPSKFTYTRGFLIPLTKIEMETTSGEKKIFESGQVIWVDGEYRLVSAEKHDLYVMIVDVSKFSETKVMNMFANHQKQDCVDAKVPTKTLVQNQLQKVPLRKVMLTSLGVSLSSMMTYLWIKVAPLQLAVGIGGLCMIGGGTLATMTIGDMLCNELQEYVDKQKAAVDADADVQMVEEMEISENTEVDEVQPEENIGEDEDDPNGKEETNTTDDENDEYPSLIQKIKK